MVDLHESLDEAMYDAGDEQGLRTALILGRHGVATVGDLLGSTPDQLMRMHGLGRKRLRHIQRWLDEEGLLLRGQTTDPRRRLG